MPASTHSLLSSSISSFFWQPVDGSAMLSCVAEHTVRQQASIQGLRAPHNAAGSAAALANPGSGSKRR